MQTYSWYVVANASDVAGVQARASALGCDVLVNDPTAGEVTAFPSAVVMAGATVVAVIADNTGQATLAEVRAAQATASATTTTAAQAVTQAQTTLQTLLANQTANSTQIAADVAMFQATAVGSTITQDHIEAFIRIVQGFATVQEAIVAHLVLTGDYTP